MSLFDHIGFSSPDVQRSLKFYQGCMSALGLEVHRQNDGNFYINGGARAPVPFIWVQPSRQAQPGAVEPIEALTGKRLHLMFTAVSREAVESFYRKAIGAGGTESGAPDFQGPAEMGYFAALVFDPDGNLVEAGFRQRKG